MVSIPGFEHALYASWNGLLLRVNVFVEQKMNKTNGLEKIAKKARLLHLNSHLFIYLKLIFNEKNNLTFLRDEVFSRKVGRKNLHQCAFCADLDFYLQF